MLKFENGRNGKIAVYGEGELLIENSNPKQIATFLNEEKPQEIEEFIFGGNSLEFETSWENEEVLRSELKRQFYEENSLFENSHDD